MKEKINNIFNKGESSPEDNGDNIIPDWMRDIDLSDFFLIKFDKSVFYSGDINNSSAYRN